MDYGWDVEGPVLAKRWEIDCIDITLTQNETPNPRTYCGKGFLRQNAEGVVSFRLYPANEKQLEWTSVLPSPSEAGKLYPGDHYYSLYGSLGSSDVRAGDNVPSGGRVGTVGSIDGTPPKLYFGLRRNATTLDPGPWLGL